MYLWVRINLGILIARSEVSTVVRINAVYSVMA